MQVKTYRGANTKGVIERIKNEMGPEAVILSSRNFTEEGRAVCEVTAALERWENPGAAQAAGHDGSVPGWGGWHQEWGLIKENLLALLRPQMDLGCLSPRHRQALDYLEREGVCGEVALRLYKALREDSDASILGPLGKLVPVKAWGCKSWPQKYHALIGPHGVGKTTAAVRMALELKQERPDLRIRIINADHARGGGRLLLRNYAELTGMDYREVSGPVDFATAVKEGRNFDKVVVDLPGLERGATFESMEKELGLEVSGDIQVHLAMSPYYSRQQFTSYLHRFFSRSVSSLVWTKLDEAYNFGAVVNTGAETGLPISALSFGAGLKGTLVPAQAAQVWRLIFKHLLPGEPTEPIQ